MDYLLLQISSWLVDTVEVSIGKKEEEDGKEEGEEEKEEEEW